MGENVENAIFCIGDMSIFGRMLHKTLGWPLYIDSLVPPVDNVLIIGMYDAPSYDYTLELTKQAKHRRIYFCGMDVQMLSRPELLPAATYLCETEGIRRELLKRGVEATICTFPTTNHLEATPYPDAPAIAFYQGNNPRRYGESLVRLIADTFPEVPILTYGIAGMDEEQLQEVVDRSSVFVSFPETDAALASCREYMEAGRRVVGTLDIDYVMTVRRDDPVGIIGKVREALALTEPDYEAAGFYRAYNSDERFIADLTEAIA